jgi:diaminopimelate decarboxylase
MQFITLRPKVVMIDPDGNSHIIRNNEKLENLMELEQMPPHLATFDL